MTPSLRLTAVALALALVVAACGGGDDDAKKPTATGNGINLNDPKAAAKAYYATYYACGADGAGLRYSLEIHDSGDSREKALDQERRKGCRPKRVPSIQVFLVAQQADQAVVTVRNPDRCADTENEDELTLLRTDAGWKVDEVRGGYVCVRNGSTSG